MLIWIHTAHTRSGSNCFWGSWPQDLRGVGDFMGDGCWDFTVMVAEPGAGWLRGCWMVFYHTAWFKTPEQRKGHSSLRERAIGTRGSPELSCRYQRAKSWPQVRNVSFGQRQYRTGPLCTTNNRNSQSGIKALHGENGKCLEDSATDGDLRKKGRNLCPLLGERKAKRNRLELH